MSSLAAMHSI